MAFALELLPDDEGTSFVKNIWQLLEESIGVTYMMRSGHEPHITIFPAQTVIPSICNNVLSRLFENPIRPIVLNLNAIGIFPGLSPVVFLKPGPSKDLISLHQAIFENRHQWSSDCSSMYAPENWIAHCTLACRFPPSDLGRVVSLLNSYLDAKNTIMTFNRLGLFDLDTNEQLISVELHC